jgi:GMP synthase (glutamine-hydrolysing)
VDNSQIVLVVKHIACEPPGLIGEALAVRGLRLQTIESHRGEPVPAAPEGHAGLVIMGGPMGVYESDRYPFLAAEMRLIEQFLKAQLPVIGVCLGSQLLAHVLGSDVSPGPQKELGWLPIEPTPEAKIDPLFQHLGGPLTVRHWHGDRFDLPAGAVHLASSASRRCRRSGTGSLLAGFSATLDSPRRSSPTGRLPSRERRPRRATTSRG